MPEETNFRPRPMVEIEKKPIPWHIMKAYSQFGPNDFIICCGYKGEVIERYFANCLSYSLNVMFDLVRNEIGFHRGFVEQWG